MPGSIEAYYQEAGRGGRDGEVTKCTLLFDLRDRRVQQSFLTRRYPDAGQIESVVNAILGLAREAPVPFAKLREALPQLRAAGADVNARTHFNETALHSAALRGWNEIVKKLVADGAELDVADGNGLTPIDFAMGRIPKGFNERNPEVRTETAALLKTLGAKVEHPNLPAWPAAGQCGPARMRAVRAGYGRPKMYVRGE